jgi:hypothetical protein
LGKDLGLHFSDKNDFMGPIRRSFLEVEGDPFPIPAIALGTAAKQKNDPMV